MNAPQETPAAVARPGRHASSALFYSVAVALGLAFTGVLVAFAWNNALRAETRSFTFNAVAARNAVEASFRTADAIIDNLASFIAADAAGDAERFARYTAGSLVRYPFIGGMARARLVDGDVAVQYGAGDFDARRFSSTLAAAGGAAALRLDSDDTVAAVPLWSGGEQGTAVLYLLQPARPPMTSQVQPLREFAVLAIDLPALVSALAVDPGLAIALFTESAGVTGRQLIYRRAAAPAADGWTIELLSQDTALRFAHFSVRLLSEKALLWANVDKGLVFVAGLLGVGVTLLLGALARARDLQARELEARNRLIEEQVRQQTRELAVARDQALEASRVKSDFLASMSHEIRTPLNAIIGMADLLSESRLDAEQEKYVGVFRNAGEALLSLVNDILDLSKIEAHQLSLEHIEFPLHELLEQALDIHALKADEKGLDLVLDIGADVPAVAVGDPGRLRQIVLNLIGNALKFTERGAIVTRLRCLAAAQGRLHLHCLVSDSGIGIPADKLESIFASFTQVDSSITRRYGGTGLGLTICRRLVEMMDGRIWAESREGEGSTFHFEVVLERALPAQGPAAAATPRAAPGRALLVAPAGPAREALAELLSAWGWTCDRIAHGDDALPPVASAGPWTLVVLDGDLGGVGAEMVAQAHIVAPDARLMVLSRPSLLAAARERWTTSPTVTHVLKPCKRAQLAAALDAFGGAVDDLDHPLPAKSIDTPASVPARRILLVEDHPDNRLLIKAYLKQEPWQVVEAENGVEAVAAMTTDGARFDLVLMDVQMPVMDGYAATRAIREWEQTRAAPTVPIVALTANAISEDRERSLAAGCSEHLTKPIKKQVLLAAIRRYLPADA